MTAIPLPKSKRILIVGAGGFGHRGLLTPAVHPDMGLTRILRVDSLTMGAKVFKN